jgi:hypothetical protein
MSGEEKKKHRSVVSKWKKAVKGEKKSKKRALREQTSMIKTKRAKTVIASSSKAPSSKEASSLDENKSKRTVDQRSQNELNGRETATLARHSSGVNKKTEKRKTRRALR